MKNSLLYFFALILPSLASSQVTFTSVDSALAYAERNSSVAKISEQQTLLAKWTRVAALANTVNFRNPVSFTATDNLLLPVNFIPAEAFGGPAGSYKQITLGQQYVSNFNFNPQIDIINPANWARVKTASINKELTETTVLINKRNLSESISAAYFNILSLQQQSAVLHQTLGASDTLVLIAQNKFGEGLIREQDLNNVKATRLAVKDKLIQLLASLSQQENSLKILCEIPVGSKITIAQNLQSGPAYPQSLKATSTLTFRNTLLQAEYAKSELRAGRWSMLPVVSAVYFQGWQQNSNQSLFDNRQPWIQSQYIGLRITMPIPADVNRLSQNYTYRINHRMALMNAAHARLQSELNNQNLELDYEKAAYAYATAVELYNLKNSNYEKSLNQYKEGILPTDFFLTSYTDMLNARINVIATLAALEHAKTRITINNLYK